MVVVSVRNSGSVYFEMSEVAEDVINVEELATELEKFEKDLQNGEHTEALKEGNQLYPCLLDKYLLSVAKTGDPLVPWLKVRAFLRHKIDGILSGYFEEYGIEGDNESQNLPKFNYTSSKEKLLTHFDSFTNAPFTIQRLCEILLDPAQHYKRTDKLMRALEKNVLVVSTVCRLTEDASTPAERALLFSNLHPSCFSPFRSTQGLGADTEMKEMSGEVNGGEEGDDRGTPPLHEHPEDAPCETFSYSTKRNNTSAESLPTKKRKLESEDSVEDACKKHQRLEEESEGRLQRAKTLELEDMEEGCEEDKELGDKEGSKEKDLDAMELQCDEKGLEQEDEVRKIPCKEDESKASDTEGGSLCKEEIESKESKEVGVSDVKESAEASNDVDCKADDSSSKESLSTSDSESVSQSDSSSVDCDDSKVAVGEGEIDDKSETNSPVLDTKCDSDSKSGDNQTPESAAEVKDESTAENTEPAQESETKEVTAETEQSKKENSDANSNAHSESEEKTAPVVQTYASVLKKDIENMTNKGEKK